MTPESHRRLPPPAAAIAVAETLPAAPLPRAAAVPAPPRARQVPHIETVHGEVRVDEYHWLRNRGDPEVIAYLEAENAYTDAVMRHTEALQAKLYTELRERILETDLSVPVRLDDHLYYSRTEQGAQYRVYCRRSVAGGAEAVLLDLNALAVGHAYLRLGAYQVSPDHRYLGYSIDTTGGEAHTLYVRDLVTGELLPETIRNTGRALAWANDSRTFFYTVLDETRRPYALYRHQLGTDPADDVLVYLEPDARFYVSVSRTRSRAFVLLELDSATTSEVRCLSADDPLGEFRILLPRRPGIEYDVAHHGDRFFILTNDGAVNFRLVEAPVSDPSPAHWREVIGHRTEVKLDGVDAFARYLVVHEREEGLPRLRIIELATGETHYVSFPDRVYALHRSENPEFDTDQFRFVYTSLVTPSMVVDYDMAARTRIVRKQTVVRGGFDATRYRTERRFALAPDGARVPISLAYRLPFVPDGTRPMFLVGYGAYGVAYEPSFSPHVLSLLDRGFVLAIAHVRGGDELGRPWYEAGRLRQKRNSFSDFIAVAEELIRSGYTSSDRLVINGASAGGLLVGAVVNMRPELFKAAIAEVPFLDVVNTMLDPTLPLTVIEYEEWGNPADPADYAYIRSYSPYDNIRETAYPHMLVTGGLNDPRVAYWEPAKWTARLRARKTDGNRLLLRTNMDAGHAGASGRYDVLRELAFKYAFVLDVVDAGLPGCEAAGPQPPA